MGNEESASPATAGGSDGGEQELALVRSSLSDLISRLEREEAILGETNTIQCTLDSMVAAVEAGLSVEDTVQLLVDTVEEEQAVESAVLAMVASVEGDRAVEDTVRSMVAAVEVESEVGGVMTSLVDQVEAEAVDKVLQNVVEVLAANLTPTVSRRKRICYEVCTAMATNATTATRAIQV